MAFIRGGDIKGSLNIGLKNKAKEGGGLLLYPEDLDWPIEKFEDAISEIDGDVKTIRNHPDFWDAKFVILVIETAYKTYKFPSGWDKRKNQYGPTTHLSKAIEEFSKFEVQFSFPGATKVAAKTVGLDLVSVQPMSAPLGVVSYLDFTFEMDEKSVKNRLKTFYKRRIKK